MANENVVTADLKGGWSCVTAPLWQWDYGQVLEITGIDDLPSSFAAHCANRWDGSSQTVLGSNGRLSIPNDLLTSGEPVYVWIVLTADGTDGETKYKITIPVNRRAAPTDYPTTAQQSAITQAINALNTAAANAAAEVAAELVDPTLSVSGKAADAAKTGEELSNLKSELVDISENTSNLFDPTGIIIGVNATGNTGFPARALSFEMNVGSNKAKVVVRNLPNNLKFEIDRYTTANASSRTGYDSVNGWITANGTYTYGYTDPVIRFLFAKNDNSKLTESDFDGLIIQVNAGLVVQPEAAFLTGKDTEARAKIDSVSAVCSPYGLMPFDVGSYQQGRIDDSTGTVVYESTYLVSDFVPINSQSILIAEKPGPTEYVIGVVCFDANKNFIKSSNYVQIHTGYKVGLTTAYVRFIVRKIVDDNYVDISIPEVRNVSMVVRYAGDAIQPSNLTVMTFNVAKWNYGITPGIPSEIYSEKLINYRRFFGEMGCDVVGLQEFERLIDGVSVDARNAIFNHWYSDSEISGSWEGIFSKYRLSGGGTHSIWGNRYYVDSYMQFRDKVIYLMNVHLSPGHDAASKVTRAAQAQDVINLLSEHEEFILFGDFNPEPDEYESLFGLFADAGYNISNAGFFGDFWTWTTNRNDFTTDTPSGTVYIIDNIITSSNIKINSVKKVNTYADLTSDHIPIIAELSLL